MPRATLRSTFVGIDPGKKGGLVELIPGKVLSVVSLIGKSERDVWDWFHDVTSGSWAVVEVVHSMPGQGVSSSFTFGQGYGALRMAAVAAGLRLEEARPVEWQRALNITPKKRATPKNRGSKKRGPKKGGESGRAFKKRLRAKAQQIFPNLDLWDSWTVEDQLAVADALLLAEYCRRTYGG